MNSIPSHNSHNSHASLSSHTSHIPASLPRLAAAMALLAFAAACAPAPPADSAAATTTISIAAAASLRPLMDELAAAYSRGGGGELVVQYGSSGNLSQQITQGAPFDLFAPADPKFLQRLAADGSLAPDTAAAEFAAGRLALAVAADAKPPGELGGLADSAFVHVAIANPAYAPHGVAAKQALESTGHWDAVSPKIVMANNVLDAANLVASGNVDAGLIALSNALAKKDELSFILLDASLHRPIIHTAAVTARGADNPRAAAFLDFLLSDTAATIIAANGFTPIARKINPATLEDAK